VIVLPGDRSNRLDVLVVGPACSAADSALIKHTQVAR
jgi:hypothetical protein